MQESTDSTGIGINRTGMQMSPERSKAMLSGAELSAVDVSAEDDRDLAAVRLENIAAADPLGSMPAPRTAKGKLKSGMKAMTGHRPQAFLDKLAERLAYERGGTRLYDAIVVKCRAYADELGEISLDQIQRIRDEEAAHALMIQECIEALGADPTAQTPSADLVGIETQGLLQAVSDPRTTLAQTLHAALAAELVDGAGWENLIAAAQQMGQDEMVERFRQALEQEQSHLLKVKHWYDALTLQAEESA